VKKIRMIELVVEVDRYVTHAELGQYVVTELAAGGGCRRPDDPLFDGIRVVEMKFRRRMNRARSAETV